MMGRDIVHSSCCELIPGGIDCGKCSLRPLSADDVGWLGALLAEKDVMIYLERDAVSVGTMIQENADGEAMNMAVITDGGDAAGFISAVPVIDSGPSMPRWKLEFAVSAAYRRCGFASAAVGGLTAYLLKHFALPRVVADICDADLGAIGVVEKCGFARPAPQYSYMNYRKVSQGMRYQWYRLQPGRRALCFVKGMQYYRTRRFIDAAAMWIEALAAPRCDDTPYSDLMLHVNIGMAYSSAGWYSQARRYLELAAVTADDTSHIKAELEWISGITGM